MKKIRVTKTIVVEYAPNLNDSWSTYRDAGVTTIEEALEHDKKDFDRQEFELVELGDEVVTVTWEIINDKVREDRS